MNILFATDGSECAGTACRLLTPLPLPADTRITVLSVVPERNWLDTPLLAEASEEEEAAAASAAASAADDLNRHGIEASLSVRRQNPAEAILEQAEADGADLIVVGSHGRGAVSRFLLGSVSERVARYARSSVLVVRGPEPGAYETPSALPSLRRVIVGVDGSESSEHALDVLTRLPLPVGVELRAIHVLRTEKLFPIPLVPGVAMDSVLEAYDREHRAAGERIVRHAQDRLGRFGHEATTEVRCGGPGHELVAAAREWNADLIVVGAANHSPLGRYFLGSVSTGVLHHAPCSVLVARLYGAKDDHLH